MGFETPKFEIQPTPEEQKKEPLPFPHAESAVAEYLKHYEGETERAQMLQEFFQEFLREELENTEVFESRESGIAMPYTSISTGKLARRIYERKTGQKFGEEDAREIPQKQKFIFATSPDIEDGDQFTTIEYAMHDSVKAVSVALEKLKRGELIEDEEIFTVGMPTNVLGKIPPELVEKISAQPFDELSKPYAEFIASKIKRGEETPKSIELLGMSLGANLAIRTGENLMDQGIVKQDHKISSGEGVPYLQIRADVPVSLGPSKIKKIQIIGGFVADGMLEFSRSDVRHNILGKAGKDFKKATRERLAERGIDRQMSDDQKNAKTKVRNKIIFALGKGLRPRPETKITEIYGLRDLTSVTPGLRREARKQKMEYAGTLGQGTLNRTSENERRFAANMMRMNPWFRENELRRMDMLARKMEEMKR